MQEHVLGNKNYSTDVKEMNGNAQIIEGVLQDEGGVGYVGVGYLFDKDGKVRKGLKVLNISKTADGRPTRLSTRQAVDSGDYPISQASVSGDQRQAGTGPRGLPGLRNRPEGQKIVEREGFFTIGAPPQGPERQEPEVIRDSPVGDRQRRGPVDEDRGRFKEAAIRGFFLANCRLWPSWSSPGYSSSSFTRHSRPSRRSRIREFLTGKNWDPTSPEKAEYGILSMIVEHAPRDRGSPCHRRSGRPRRRRLPLGRRPLDASGRSSSRSSRSWPASPRSSSDSWASSSSGPPSPRSSISATG